MLSTPPSSSLRKIFIFVFLVENCQSLRRKDYLPSVSVARPPPPSSEGLTCHAHLPCLGTMLCEYHRPRRLCSLYSHDVKETRPGTSSAFAPPFISKRAPLDGEGHCGVTEMILLYRLAILISPLLPVSDVSRPNCAGPSTSGPAGRLHIGVLFRSDFFTSLFWGGGRGAFVRHV